MGRHANAQNKRNAFISRASAWLAVDRSGLIVGLVIRSKLGTRPLVLGSTGPKQRGNKPRLLLHANGQVPRETVSGGFCDHQSFWPC
jgi:hypothetical protein